MLQRRRERHRCIKGGNAHDGAVEIVKRFFIDDGCKFAGQAAGLCVFMQKNDFVGFLYGLRDGIAIERAERAQINDFDRPEGPRRQSGDSDPKLRRPLRSQSNDAALSSCAACNGVTGLALAEAVRMAESRLMLADNDDLF